MASVVTDTSVGPVRIETRLEDDWARTAKLHRTQITNVIFLFQQWLIVWW